MSSSASRRRRRWRMSPLSSPAPAGGAAAPVQEQVVVAADDELVSRLRALLPREAAANNGEAKASSRARVLREAGVYIRRLHAELDAAAERLARLLDDDTPAAANAGAADDEPLMRNLLM